MKTKLALPAIRWAGKTLSPEIYLIRNRKTAHVRWSIYTMDNDYVLSETLSNLFSDKAVYEMPFLLFRDFCNTRKSEVSSLAYIQGCIRWGSGRYLPPELTEAIANCISEIYIEAMEYCFKHQESILGEWQDWISEGRRRENRPKIEWSHLKR